MNINIRETKEESYSAYTGKKNIKEGELIYEIVFKNSRFPFRTTQLYKFIDTLESIEKNKENKNYHRINVYFSGSIILKEQGLLRNLNSYDLNSDICAVCGNKLEKMDNFCLQIKARNNVGHSNIVDIHDSCVDKLLSKTIKEIEKNKEEVLSKNI